MWRFLFKSDKFETIRFPIGRFAEDLAILDRILYDSKIVYVPERFYNYYYCNQANSSNKPENKYKNIVDRAIAFSGRYGWMKGKTDIDEETKQVVLCKAVYFCLAAFCRYKKYSYDKNDVANLYKFLKDNRKKIKKLKGLGILRKISCRLLLLAPGMYSSIGAIIKRN